MRFQIFFLLIIFPLLAHSQINFGGGVGFSTVRTKEVNIDQSAFSGTSMLASVRVYALKRVPRLSFQSGVQYVTKGYKQKVDQENFRFKIPQFGWHVGLGCDFGNNFRGAIGGYFSEYVRPAESLFLSARYDIKDNGLFASVHYRFVEYFELFVRYEHGLSRLMRYDLMDQYGNITASGSDFRLSTVSIGVAFSSRKKFFLYDEE